MRFVALACDYDGTLATHGEAPEEVLTALGRVLASGRRLLLVTGRELEDLMHVFPRLDLFERVVAENGGLLYRPSDRSEKRLAAPPPAEFVQALRMRGVGPISVGRSIVATWEPHETTVLEVIRDLGLELHVIFNKGSVMVLPSGINKWTGLNAALDELALSAHNVVGVGDAENDHAFLSACECGVAVANALPGLKERADFTTTATHGAGVIELIDMLVSDDLRSAEPRLGRRSLLLGKRDDEQEVRLKPYGVSVLLAGPSASGKSTTATALLERITEQDYQFCLIDPEGDYEHLESGVVLGDVKQAPTIDEVLQLLKNPHGNVIVNLLGLKIENRPAFLAGLLPHLQELQAKTGRPHWLIVDEAHHLLPASWDPASLSIPREFGGVLLITVHPKHLASGVLSAVDVVIAMGEGPDKTLRSFSEALGQRSPSVGPVELESNEALVWFRREKATPVRMSVAPPRAEHRRHVRKYAEGDVGPERSFYFRGPQGRLNLRAQNLLLFTQIGDGVDDQTWLYHLRRGDYSRWFREAVKDDELAAEAEQIQKRAKLSAQKSRALIREAIERYYTLPEGPPFPIAGTGVQARGSAERPRTRPKPPVTA